MRRIILFACFCLSTIIACAQLSSSSGKWYTNLPGIDYVFIINGITPSTEITFNGTGTSINWYKFSNPTTSISNVSYISPENGTGYTLNVDGKLTHIWVIDYASYIPVFTSFGPDTNTGSQCSNVNLLIDASVPALSYQDSVGTPYSLPRNFSIKYQTLSWTDGAWKQIDTVQSVVLPTTQTSVKAPYTNTTFTLSGDQYAADLGLTPYSITSSMYTPVAVICHPTTVVTSREHDRNNEADAPSTALPIDFSAPIDVQFLSNANVPVTQFYRWTISKDAKILADRSDKDQRYTFTDYGTYIVKLKVSNATCSFTDSLVVNVSESAIYVPNVFTPNGDRFNNEFRVAYKSLISFQCWVYDRWGRQVYYWNDPTKGWDGNIGSKKAVPGAYFYIIKALGSDKKVYKLKGDINLLR